MPDRILGIDPGIASMGFGLIDDKNGEPTTIDYGCLTTSSKQKTTERLHILHWGVMEIIDRYQPSVMAIESFIARNLKTALSVGQARGVAILAAANHGLSVYEYSPLEVKQKICGYGHGDKRQIQEMVKIQLGLEFIPEPDHAADALAVAICHIGNIRLSRILEESQ